MVITKEILDELSAQTKVSPFGMPSEGKPASISE